VTKRWVLVLAMALLFVSACSNEVQKVVPLGDHGALEELAQAYRSVSEAYPVQPQAMPLKARVHFLGEVFEKAGFNYSKTLLSVAKADTKVTNQDHRDLVELLLIPGKGVLDADMGSLYEDEELAAALQLRKVFH
jgi:hypothetical protein